MLSFWTPLLGDITQQGLSNYSITTIGSGATVNTNGKLGKCYYLDGTTNGYINTNFPTNVGTDDFTISLWVKIPTISSGSYYAICTSKTTTATSVGFGIYWNYSQKKFLWSTADGTNATEIWMADSVDSIVYDKWIHLVMVRNNSDAKKGYFYINGTRYELASVPAIRNIATASYLMIGKCTNGSYPCKMYVNDLRVYIGKALSPKEIRNLSLGMVCHYPLNGGGRTNNNMISGTHRSDFSTTSTSVSDGKLSVGSGGNGTFSITTDTTCPIGKYSYNVLNNTAGNRDFQQANIPYVTGKKYTGSWWAKGSGTCLYRVWNATKGTQEMGVTFTLTSEWKHYSYTFTANENMGTDNCTFHLGVTGASSINICGMKLEEGEQATPWMPNSADSAYTAMGYDSLKIYDVSGYKYNSTLSATTTYSSNSARYSVSTYFGTYATPYAQLDNPEILSVLTNCTVAWWEYCTTSGNTLLFSGDIDIKYIAAGSSSTRLYDRSIGSSGIKLYRDGIEVSTTQGDIVYHPNVFHVANEWHYFVLTGVNLSTWTKFYINHYSNNWPLVAYLSDFRIYATALSDTQVAELYNTAVSVANNGTLMGYELVEV